jgi:S1-C subfamily serine protease
MSRKIDYDPYPAIGGTQFNRNFSLNTDALEWRLRVAQEIQKEEDPIKKIIQDNIQASCTVMVYSENSFWTGSGFHLGNGIVVTASHVAPQENAIDAHLSFDGKHMYPAELLVSDKNLDVALLYSPQVGEYIHPVALGDSDTLEIGDIIATITSPEGWNDTATVGRVSNIHQGLGKYAPSPAWIDIFFIDADILQGSSGGMVIGTDGLVYGSVVGVTGQHAELGIGQRAVCPSNKIKTLIENLKETQSIEQPSV